MVRFATHANATFGAPSSSTTSGLEATGGTTLGDDPFAA